MALTELAVFAGAFTASAALTRLVRRFATAAGLLDIPNARSSHTEPRPRGGGLAIVATVLAATVLAALLRPLPGIDVAAIAIGGSLVAAVGYYDDCLGMSAAARLFVQLVAAALTVGVLAGFGTDVPVFPRLHASVAAFLVVIGILWATNLFNFMDGIDGIAASQAAFVASATAILIAVLRDPDSPWVFLPVATAGACFGFLVWNWPPARIFMGDVGSGFLGFWLAATALALHQAGLVSIWTSTILGSAFIADATVTLLRRVIRRERWHEAHRSHAYQRLATRWQSHRKVTLLLWILNVAMVFPLAARSMIAPQDAPALAVATLAAFALLALVAGAGAGAGEQDPAA